MIENVKVYKDQNVVDLALQEYGSVEGLIKLSKRNDLDIDEDPAPGNIIKIETTEVVMADVRTFYKNKNFKVSTGTDI